MLTRRELIGLVMRTLPILPLTAALGTAPAVDAIVLGPDALEFVDSQPISAERIGLTIVSSPIPMKYIRYQVILPGQDGRRLGLIVSDEPFHLADDATREEIEQAFVWMAERLWDTFLGIPGALEAHERATAQAGQS